ncbi:MAG: DUF1592 domain-containing protein [Alphaproteobacteria bacterium]|nr:DUF1592 domain-containing protein [Alphaproteobacteria bacterium]
MRSLWVLALGVGCGVAEPPAAEDSTVLDTGTPDPQAGLVDPGRVALRRLTRGELERTVRDLLGFEPGILDGFPVDDATDGFDVVGEGLAVSPLHVELYERTAAKIATWILDRPLQAPLDVRQELEDGTFSIAAAYGGVRGTHVALWSEGELTGQLTFPADGTYRVTLEAWADQAGDALPMVGIGVGFGTPEVVEIDATSSASPGRYAVEVELPRGRHAVTLGFLNDFLDGDADRNVYLDALRIEGPLDFEVVTNPARDRWITCEPDAPPSGMDARACVASIVEALATTAWRRPLEPGELDDLLAVVDEVLAAGDPASWGLEFALRAIFASPHFVFHVEPPPPVEGEALVPDHVLASRLSYLLWSSLPDAELRALADAGTLHRRDVLAAQVDRMLSDPRASALAEDFAGQWLMIRAVDDPTPDFFTYPLFNEGTRASMKGAMLRLFEDFVFEDEPLTRLLDGEWTYVDRALADIYKLPPFGFDDELERFDLGDEGRRGWLTQPGLLMATSYPTRTSPVKRGVWVMSELLCETPEAPPPGVEGFPEATETAATVRQRLEAHRSKPQCAVCHDDFDPLGLAFEHYDGIGKFREADAGEPVDASGELPDGTVVGGVEDLAAVLAEDERFARCAVRKAFTYAHRRAPVPADEPYLDEVLARSQAEGFSLQAVLTALVTSRTFRMHGATR